ncbi:MAG TPA: hypothetical protein VKG62_01520, partial [Solirubrobacteraceae bacterium]|nr:hypothetical protein [Solirubrobacteraceae bacterium]
MPCALALALVASAAEQAPPARAGGASTLSWSAPSAFDTPGLPTNGVSCPSESLCVAVDHAGNALASTDPTSPTPAWTSASIDPGGSLDSVSCASPQLCAAVDGGGGAFVSTDPTVGAWSGGPIDSGRSLTGVSCPTESLCVAVDSAGYVVATLEPRSKNPTWRGSTESIDPGNALKAISCVASWCFAVDSGGAVLSSSDPTGGKSAWRRRAVDPVAGMTGVSCPSEALCVAVDGTGDVLTSDDPTALYPTWSSTQVDASGGLAGVSCAPTGLCVAVGEHGEELASEGPLAPFPLWSEAIVDTSESHPVAMTGISCLSGGFCLAVDSSGRGLTARVPPPTVITASPPAEVTATTASLSGSVDPEDAVLSGCFFEYGTTAGYGQSVPCGSLPSPAGGLQAVGAPIAGLIPNTTYHYRLLARTPAGTGYGADVAFTTPVSSLIPIVYPHPSIAGTPAVGERLTCHSGVPSGSIAQVSYAWLRDLLPIPRQTGSTYVVGGADVGRHLQCAVTASDGGGSATARSAFVTVPVEGVQASSGETTVGRAGGRGDRVSVSVLCSGQAPQGCQILLRLTAVETLSGGRVVAISARAPRLRRGAHAGQSHRLTVMLGLTRARLSRGQRATVSVILSAVGRRLLATLHRLPLAVSVSGTVIGVIEADLAEQTVELGAGTHASRAPSRRIAGASPATRRRVSSGAPARGAGGGNALSILSPTPYMGWDTYFAFGPHYSESRILTQASRLLSLGLAGEGYRYVWLDVGWWQGSRDASGQITVNPAQWPHGMAWLTRTLHAAGFRVGLYTDAGPGGCGGAGEGSYGHYQQDVNTFAAWGFDAVKVDFCGGAEAHLNPAAAYSAFHAAIEANSSHRPMLLSICNFLQPGEFAEGQPTLEESAFSSYSFGPGVGNSWRTDTDVGFPGDVTFGDVLRNMDADAAQP